MRKMTHLALLVLVLVGVVSGGSVLAQDSKVVCDSDLILNLYTAEYYLNFSAIRDTLMAGGMEGVDLSKIDHGPYAPAFDAMMGMMDSNMAMEGSAITGDTAEALVAALQMSPDEMMGMMTMPEGATALAPAVVADEPAECTALRAELTHFNQALLYVNEQMMMAQTGS
jgi:hypothetical protein